MCVFVLGSTTYPPVTTIYFSHVWLCCSMSLFGPLVSDGLVTVNLYDEERLFIDLEDENLLKELSSNISDDFIDVKSASDKRLDSRAINHIKNLVGLATYSDGRIPRLGDHVRLNESTSVSLGISV